MDKYTATEQAFKHGYEKGYQAAKKEAESEILILKQKRANIIEILNAYERGFVDAKAKWIPVSERLPDKHDKCLALVPSKLRGHAYFTWMVWYDPKIGFYDSDHVWGDIEMNDVTHWMPLPEPPKEGE